MLDWHTYLICDPLEIKLLLLDAKRERNTNNLDDASLADHQSIAKKQRKNRGRTERWPTNIKYSTHQGQIMFF